MKYDIVTRTVIVRRTTVDAMFPNMMAEKTCDQVMRQAALHDLPMGDPVGTPVTMSEKTNVSRIERNGKHVWGNKAIAAKSSSPKPPLLDEKTGALNEPLGEKS